MPLKTNIGVSRKVADNNYGSRGASVNLEVELDSALINDPQRFHERIRQVFRLAQQAIDEELGRQQPAANHATDAAASNGRATPQNGSHATPQNGSSHATNGNTNGNGRAATNASEKQLTYARQLAKSINGLGIRNLETLAQKMFSKPLAGLSTLDASGLIDTLKSIKTGEIDIKSVLNGAAS